jgi:heat shock protein HtpX
MNNVKVFVLMAGMTALVVALGSVLGGSNGAMLAFGMAAVMNLGMLWGSSTIVLRSYGARVVTEAEAPDLYRMVDRLRQRAELPMPVVAIAPHDQPNAFATGRNPENSVVCVTEGLMRVINREELEGVIAHELAHIKNRDMLLQTIAATMSGAISNLARFAFFFGGRRDEGGNPAAALIAMIVAPIAAMLMQFAISRQREFKADKVGAEICGRPLALAGALQKLEMSAKRIPMDVSPAVAPLAIVNPLAAVKGLGIGKLFSTHPPTAERVARLEALAATIR